MNQSSKKPLDENTELMRKVADGDIEAFRLLYQKFVPLMMYWFVMRGVDHDLAEDLVHKIFARLWDHRKSLHIKSSFKAYLYNMTRNTLYEELRQFHKVDEVSSKKQVFSDEDTYKNFSQPEVELYLQELTDAVEAAKAKLTDEQIQALEVAQEADINLDKKLEKLGCSKEAYKKRLKRGRKRLMKLLAQFFTDKNG